MKQKKYVKPIIIVKNVDLKNYILGVSTTGFRTSKSGCENWTNNMESVLGDNNGMFHNGFEIDDSWGDDAGAL
ncbi:MAG: hypothetical protein J1F40_03555 [Prevotellaceae bacterium]|nr:hypothetical protein [Prevotellaceae bacterium]